MVIRRTLKEPANLSRNSSRLLSSTLKTQSKTQVIFVFKLSSNQASSEEMLQQVLLERVLRRYIWVVTSKTRPRLILLAVSRLLLSLQKRPVLQLLPLDLCGFKGECWYWWARMGLLWTLRKVGSFVVWNSERVHRLTVTARWRPQLYLLLLELPQKEANQAPNQPLS